MVFSYLRLAAATAAGVAAAAAAASAASKVGPSHWCDVAMDFVHLQDATSSFDSLWKKMESQIGRVVDELQNVNVKNNYAFLTFGDKPIRGGDNYQLGYKDDYCLKVDVPLGKPNSAKMRHLFANYQQTARGGGGDWAENSFDAVLRTIYSPAVGWSADVKTIILITDALGHREGDVAKLTGVEVAKNTINFPSQLAASPNAECSTMDYPTVDQVAAALNENNVTLIIFAAPAGMYDANGNFKPYSFIAKEGKKYRQANGLALWYKDQFDAAGANAVFSVMIDAALDTFALNIIKAIDEIASGYCPTTEPLHPTDAPTNGPTHSTIVTSPPTTTQAPTTTALSSEGTEDDPTLPGQGATGGCTGGGQVTDSPPESTEARTIAPTTEGRPTGNDPTLPGQGGDGDGCRSWAVEQPLPAVVVDPQPLVVEVNLNYLAGLPTPSP